MPLNETSPMKIFCVRHRLHWWRVNGSTAREAFLCTHPSMPSTRLHLNRPQVPFVKSSIRCDLIEQRGLTAFDLQAILQKRDNSLATSNKMMRKTTDSRHSKLKMGK